MDRAYNETIGKLALTIPTDVKTKMTSFTETTGLNKYETVDTAFEKIVKQSSSLQAQEVETLRHWEHPKIPTVDTVWQSSASVVVADLYNPKIPNWFMKPELSGSNLTEETLKKSVNVQTTKPYKENFKIIRQEQSDGRWYVYPSGRLTA